MIIDFELLDKKFNAAEWADVLDILDEYFDEQPLPTYSDLKNSITHSLSSGNLPNPALVQALKIRINELKSIFINDDEFNKQNRELAIRREGIPSEYYNYLVKFPYHKNYETLNKHFRTIEKLKIKTLIVSVRSKRIGTLPKFELITKHFLPNTMSRGESLRPKVMGYTISRFAVDEHAIATKFICHLSPSTKREEDIDEKDIKKLFIEAIRGRLADATLVLPYVIAENATDEHYERFLAFIDQYWKPLIDELRTDAIQYMNRALVLLLLVEQKTEDKIPGFSRLTDSSTYNDLPDNVKLEIDPVCNLDCNSWINNADGFFYNYYDKCKRIHATWRENHESYFPECNTIEGFFEKITTDISDTNISLYEIFNKKIYKP